MWSNYIKTFVFRDCFEECMVEGNVSAINKLLNLEQANKSYGAFITTDILSTSIADSFGAYRSEDDGTLNLKFYKGDEEVATISLWHYKEVHLSFEIEEEVETGEFVIHYCTVTGFKDYQL